MFGLLSLIPGPFKAILLVGVVAAGGAVVWSYNSALRDNEKLRANVARLETNINRMKSVENVLRANIKLRDATIEGIDDHKRAFGKDLKEACELWEKVKKSDTPVEDVLDALKENNREP